MSSFPRSLKPEGYERARPFGIGWACCLFPLVLAMVAFFLTRSENRYALQLQARREAEARKIEEQRAQTPRCKPILTR